MTSRTSRAATTREPSSSPTSAVRPTNGSSWSSRRHWHASSQSHTSSGYHASAARTAASSPPLVVEDGARRHLEQPLLRRAEPVPRGDASARIEADPLREPRAELGDLDVVRDGTASQPKRVGQPRNSSGRPASIASRTGVDVAGVDEHLQPRPPAVVGRALGVEAEHLGAGADQRRGMSPAFEQRRDDLFVVRPRELEARDEARRRQAARSSKRRTTSSPALRT